MRKSLEKTSYPGVSTYTDDSGQKTFYIRYRRGGRGTPQKNEPVGKASEGMTAKKASLIRADRMRGALSNSERRKKDTAAKETASIRWTLENLWEAYKEAHPKDDKDDGRSREIWLFNNRLKKLFGNKTVDDLTTKDIDHFRNQLLKKGLKPATVRLPMELMRRQRWSRLLDSPRRFYSLGAAGENGSSGDSSEPAASSSHAALLH